jgi:hypothetical protein
LEAGDVRTTERADDIKKKIQAPHPAEENKKASVPGITQSLVDLHPDMRQRLE